MKKVAKKPEVFFCDTNHRKYVEIKMEFEEGTKNIQKKVIDRILKSNIKDAVVQINLILWESDLISLDFQKIADSCKGAYYVRPIVPTITRAKTLKNSEITVDTEPERAIESFIKEHEPEDAEDIEQMALALLRGLEIEL